MARLLPLLVFAASTAHAESFFESGFRWASTGGAPSAAVTVKATVVVQLGTEHLVGLNAESGVERWRFTSRAKTLRQITLKSGALLVQAEQLHALNPLTGDELWQFPLNCFPGKCNSKVRLVTDEVVVLTGFDGKEDNLLLLDAHSGGRLWPSWVRVEGIDKLLVTPAAVLVSSKVAPFAVVALDRYTSRERWRLRPDGIEGPAAGLETDGTALDAWWLSGNADVVVAADLATGKVTGEWAVARRKGAIQDRRGTAPGVVVAWQSSVLGGGSLRGYDNRDGTPRWKKALGEPLGPPLLIGDRVLFRQRASSGAVTITAWSAALGEELWRYTRADATAIELRLESGRVLALVDGATRFVGLIDLIEGRVESVAVPEPQATIRYAAGALYAFHGKTVERLDSIDGAALVERFNTLVRKGEVDAADALARRTKPFVGELRAAAVIHKAVGAQGYQDTSSKMRGGGLPPLLARLQAESSDDRMTFYDEYRVFILKAAEELQRTGVSALSGDDLSRLVAVAQRFTDLAVRFERQLSGQQGTDAPAIKAVGNASAVLGECLIASSRPDAAYASLRTLWVRSWLPHGGPLIEPMRTATATKLRELLPAFESAVATQSDMDLALAQIAELVGIDAVVTPAPAVEDIPDMAPGDFAVVLERLRAATR